jgi:hypothetical protein
VSRLARVPAWALTAAGALLWLLVDPPTPDLPAHLYRAEIGLGIWNNGWYAGHHLPGYSVLVPPLASLTSPQLVAAACAVIATWCFERLARDHWTGAAATAAVLWFALAALSPLVAGQLVFAAGLAPGLGALLAARRGHTALGVLLAAATTLTSPVAAAFLCLALAAWLVAGGGRPAAALLAGAIVPGLLLLALFPEGGTQPFSVSSFAWAFVLALVLAAVLPREERALRAGAVLYAAGLLVAVVLDTPVGGNAVRFAAVFGGPLAAGALWDRRRVALALLAVPLLYYQWLAPVRAVVRSSGDPSTEAAYFAPLIAELDRRAASEGPLRLEIPFTSSHFEAAEVAPAHPLARGWLRQVDVAENGLFYDEAPLTGARYRAWLDRLGVRYVAVPGADLDEAGKDEARLVRERRVPGVEPVWRGGDWTLYRVAGSPPLATPPVRVTRISAGEIGLDTPRPATAVVRVRFSRQLALTRGRGCVSRAPGGFTRVQLERAGPATLGTRLRLLPAKTRCKR